MKANKIIFINQKGGVGKTTTCLNTGAYIAKTGKKVLLLDLDSQGNLSSGVGADKRLPGSYELMVGKSGKEIIQKTKFDNLDCIVGGINMAGFSVEAADVNNREFYLKNAMKEIDTMYDYILCDCPPSLDLVTINALVWTDKLIIPMQCEYYAMEGINLLHKTIYAVRQKLNPNIETLGIVFTMYTKRAKLSNEVVNNIRDFFKDSVFETMIPRNVTVSEAPSHGMPLAYYDNSCAGAKAYESFSKEVIKRVNK